MPFWVGIQTLKIYSQPGQSGDFLLPVNIAHCCFLSSLKRALRPKCTLLSILMEMLTNISTAERAALLKSKCCSNKMSSLTYNQLETFRRLAAAIRNGTSMHFALLKNGNRLRGKVGFANHTNQGADHTNHTNIRELESLRGEIVKGIQTQLLSGSGVLQLDQKLSMFFCSQYTDR